MHQLVWGRADQRALDRMLAMGADDDRTRVVLLGQRQQGVDRPFGDQRQGRLHARLLRTVERRRGRPLAELAHLLAMGRVAKGAERVDFAGGQPWERGLAQTLGARLLDESFPDRLGPYPITVDASADRAGLGCALRSTEPDGLCTSIGIYFDRETPVPLLEMFTKGIRFHTGRPQARPTMEPILELVRDGTFHPELVTRETATWDDAAEAVAGHGGKLVISREG